MVICNKRGGKQMYYAEYESPVGRLLFLSDGCFLTHVLFDVEVPEGAVSGENVAVLEKTAGWLHDYFRGDVRPIDIPLNPEGTEFQKTVWAELAGIGYGQTRTYGDIARAVRGRSGGRMSAQAVGQAVGKNPISILVPCHRVVGAKGQMTGYAWGVEKKVWLLRHEGIDITEKERIATPAWALVRNDRES